MIANARSLKSLTFLLLITLEIDDSEVQLRKMGYACEMRHHRDAAAARSASLAGGEQTKPSLIQVRRDCLIAHTNGVPVDHFINI